VLASRFYSSQGREVQIQQEVHLSSCVLDLSKRRTFFLSPMQGHEGDWYVFGFIKKTTSYGMEKNVFTLHIPPWAPHTYDFVVITSLTHPRKILFVVLQITRPQLGTSGSNENLKIFIKFLNYSPTWQSSWWFLVHAPDLCPVPAISRCLYCLQMSP
jgi:hypothetical protein